MRLLLIAAGAVVSATLLVSVGASEQPDQTAESSCLRGGPLCIDVHGVPYSQHPSCAFLLDQRAVAARGVCLLGIGVIGQIHWLWGGHTREI